MGDAGPARAHGTDAIKAMAATAIAQIWRILVSFASAAVLGRLLTPADFGLVAASAPVLAFTLMLQNLGLNQAVIQREDITAGQIDAIFWIGLGVSAVLAVLLAIAAPALALFLREPKLAGLIAASAGLVLLAGLSQQPMALLTRRLSFGVLAAIDMTALAGGTATAFAIAAWSHSYWALFAAPAVTALIGTLAAWGAAGWRPTRPVFDPGVRDMIRFGAGLSVFSFFNYLARNADNLLIARYRGPVELGLYDRAYKLMLFPLMQSTYPLGRVMQPILSRLQNAPDRYRTAYQDCVTLLMAATQPGILVAVMFSGPVIRVLLGPNWGAAAPIFAWLGLSGLHQVFTATTGWLFISQGRGRQYALVGVFGSVTSILSFVIGLRWGALGVAACYTLSDIALRMPVTWSVAGSCGPVGRADIVRLVSPHLASIGVSASVLWLLHRHLADPGIGALALATLISYTTSIAVLLAFPACRGAAARMLLLVIQLRGRPAPRAQPARVP